MRNVSRRSFLALVALTGCTTSGGGSYDPRDDLRRGEGCTDGDSGSRFDPPGAGRHCRFGETRRRPRRHDD